MNCHSYQHCFHISTVFISALFLESKENVLVMDIFIILMSSDNNKCNDNKYTKRKESVMYDKHDLAKRTLVFVNVNGDVVAVVQLNSMRLKTLDIIVC